MEIHLEPQRRIWAKLCLRPSSANPAVARSVKSIVGRVRRHGDKAIRELSMEIDHLELEEIQVSEAEILEACANVSDTVKEAISQAAANIELFHKAQMPKEIRITTAPGVKCIQRPVPIGKVGLYIPGGTAPLFSTVLMLAIPARIAGCNEVILCTPAGRDGKVSAEVLYAASYCGVGKIFKLGGAQAIAAMAYGTRSIPKVDKIFGPGNQYVTTAKQMLGGHVVSIDMPAGPSEVMVIADSSAKPEHIAADLLSQAEHGRDSQVMLVCPDLKLAESTRTELEKQSAELSRAGFVEEALSKSRTVIFKDREKMIEFANSYAPEHLIIATTKPWEIADRITSAGSVFVGKYTPESAGDYASGTNHTLPTCGWGRSYSGVNLESFMRRMTIQEISKKGLQGLSGTIVAMAEAEGLQAHANAVKVRLK